LSDLVTLQDELSSTSQHTYRHGLTLFFSEREEVWLKTYSMLLQKKMHGLI